MKDITKFLFESKKSTASIYYMYNSSFDNKYLKEIDKVFNELIENIKDIIKNETIEEDNIYFEKIDAHQKCVTFKNCNAKDWNKLKQIFEKFVKTDNHFNRFFNNYEKTELSIIIFPKPLNQNKDNKNGIFLTLQKNYKD